MRRARAPSAQSDSCSHTVDARAHMLGWSCVRVWVLAWLWVPCRACRNALCAPCAHSECPARLALQKPPDRVPTQECGQTQLRPQGLALHQSHAAICAKNMGSRRARERAGAWRALHMRHCAR